ncbi:F-box protein SKIP23-like [Pistacia vera]|uniref:F-box protein SKIP23-like n=1 Tax=Pistacia vera TaxID=55513 RepID=UPI001262E66B|nr:F-box protein SKIP23-like [Pistacia vera]
MARVEPDWSTLPEDLLFSIVKLLPTQIDILRFRAVCRSFRATIAVPSEQYPFPHSILTTTDFLKGTNLDEKDIFDFMVSTVYVIEPLNKTSQTHDEETPQTWVVKVQEPSPGTVRIIDPITGSECQNLSNWLPKSLNLLDYRVTEITKSYELKSTVELLSKVIFSSSLDENEDEFTVMASDSYGKELGIWRNLDKKWSKIDIELKFPEFFVEDIYHDRKFYAVLTMGYTVTVDPKSLVVTRVAGKVQLYYECAMLYLIGLNNDLFFIVQFQDGEDDYDEYNIAIFKLNEENQKWVPVVDGSELEDRELFVGKSSLSILGRNREEAAEMIVRKHPKLVAMMVKEGSIVNICGYGLIVSRQAWKGEANAANQAENGEMNA